MNEERPINATALINNLSILKRVDEDLEEYCNMMIDRVRKMPTLTHKAEWVVSPGHKIPTKHFICSNCRNEIETKVYTESCYYNFCPNCGYSMRDDKDEQSV